MNMRKIDFNGHIKFILNKINLLFLILFISLLNFSCSSSYMTLDSSLKNQLSNDLKTGEAHLECTLMCVNTWVKALPYLKSLHDNRKWRQLALETQKIGYSDNLSWYYLGRAAEGLQAKNAAKKYYKISIEKTSSGVPCNTRCNNHNFPQDSSSRLSRLGSSRGKRIDGNTPSYSLFVNVEPSNAVIKIMNIIPKFKQGIKLTPGNYKLKIQQHGFRTITKTIKMKDSAVTASFKMVPTGLSQGDENQGSEPLVESADFSIETAHEPKATNLKTSSIVTKDTELKSQPTLFSSVSAKLKQGEKVHILENLGDWIKVKTTQGQGYVYSDSLR